MYKRVKYYNVVAIMVIIFSLVLAGCSLKVGYSSSSSVNKTSASFMVLSDTEEKLIKLKNDDIIAFEYKIKLEKGTLSAKLEDSAGNEIVSFEPNTSGIKDVKIDKDGTYKLIIKGNDAKGSYKFEWDIK